MYLTTGIGAGIIIPVPIPINQSNEKDNHLLVLVNTLQAKLCTN
jgi:hypothetical protein